MRCGSRVREGAHGGVFGDGGVQYSFVDKERTDIINVFEALLKSTNAGQKHFSELCTAFHYYDGILEEMKTRGVKISGILGGLTHLYATGYTSIESLAIYVRVIS